MWVGCEVLQSGSIKFDGEQFKKTWGEILDNPWVQFGLLVLAFVPVVGEAALAIRAASAARGAVAAFESGAVAGGASKAGGWIGKVGAGGNANSITQATLKDALRADKLDHIFVTKHKFEPLLARFGSREAVMEQIVRSIGSKGLPKSGPFEITRNIAGRTVVIRGAVVDGVPRIWTAFTP